MPNTRMSMTIMNRVMNVSLLILPIRLPAGFFCISFVSTFILHL